MLKEEQGQGRCSYLLVDQVGEDIQDKALKARRRIQGLNSETHEQWRQWVPAGAAAALIYLRPVVSPSACASRLSQITSILSTPQELSYTPLLISWRLQFREHW